MPSIYNGSCAIFRIRVLECKHVAVFFLAWNKLLWGFIVLEKFANIIDLLQLALGFHCSWKNFGENAIFF